MRPLLTVPSEMNFIVLCFVMCCATYTTTLHSQVCVCKEGECLKSRLYKANMNEDGVNVTPSLSRVEAHRE